MSGWSVGIAKIFGVEVRLHSFFLFLIVPAGIWAEVLGRTVFRGIALWALVLLAVVVRETARALTAAYLALDVQSMVLLPTGGFIRYADREAQTRAEGSSARWALAFAGPLANLAFGVIVAGFALSVAPVASLWPAPWVSPLHLLRSMVWVNLLLAGVNLLPALPLGGLRMVSGKASPTAEPGLRPVQARMRMRTSWLIASVLMVYGFATLNWWVIVAGLGVLLGSQLERHSAAGNRSSDLTKVGDVMLTDYTVLPASATLEDAMMHARHSLQDVFPVVRAGNMVGAVGRQKILDALATTGNGYVQGIMTRSFQTAAVDDLLAETLDKAAGPGSPPSLQIVPVVRDTAVVGILTWQHLHRSRHIAPRRIAHAGRDMAGDESD